MRLTRLKNERLPLYRFVDFRLDLSDIDNAIASNDPAKLMLAKDEVERMLKSYVLTPDMRLMTKLRADRLGVKLR